MSIAEVPFSDLIQHSRKTVDQLEKSRGRRLRLVRRDGEDLILESAARAEADMEALAMATRLVSAMLDTDEGASMLVRVMTSVFPWVRFLPVSEARVFAGEFTETARACADLGNMAALQPVIEAWRATAEVHSDPDLLRTLTTPADGTDYGPVPEPEAAAG
jgi:hypothetical protein